MPNTPGQKNNYLRGEGECQVFLDFFKNLKNCPAGSESYSNRIPAGLGKVASEEKMSIRLWKLEDTQITTI
jgi:hypothetical protein